MRVFVTGGGRGFIGGHLVTALEHAGHEVRREWADVRDGEAVRLIARAARRRPPRIRLPYAAAQGPALVGLANAHEVPLARAPIESAVARAVEAALAVPAP